MKKGLLKNSSNFGPIETCYLTSHIQLISPCFSCLRALQNGDSEEFHVKLSNSKMVFNFICGSLPSVGFIVNLASNTYYFIPF